MAFLLLGAVIFLCRGIANYYPLGGVEILSDGSIVPLPSPPASHQRILAILNIVQPLSCILFPGGGLIVSVFLFYYLKLKQPISDVYKRQRQQRDEITEEQRDTGCDYVIEPGAMTNEPADGHYTVSQINGDCEQLPA